MKRLDIEALMALAHEHRAFIEVDSHENIAVASVAGVEYYAVIAPAVDGRPSV